jgi:His-Xaa-Ser system radical SAM maturase HxsB
MNEKILSGLRLDDVSYLRYGRVGAKYLLTGEEGQFAFVPEKDFELFLRGKLPRKSAAFKTLAANGFVRSEQDLVLSAQDWRRRNSFLGRGPGLHIVVVTLRCDHHCVYCQAGSLGEKTGHEADMSPATARRVAAAILSSPNKNINVEFQGGEPLLNWPVVEFFVKHMRAEAKRKGRKIQLSLVTNMALMDDKKLDFLLSSGVNICTSLDGPEHIHNRNRVSPSLNSYKNTMRWFKKIGPKAARAATRMDALLTVTRAALPYGTEIVDTYVQAGAQAVFLRPLNPLGTASKVWDAIGYDAAEFLKFYEGALRYILDLNLNGTEIRESTAELLLVKILRGRDPNFMDLRSPCGAGIGQLAYYYDGKVFSCDEGRMLYEMGDASFMLGDLARDRYEDLMSCSATKCLVTASCLELQPQCDACVYKPYCGVCPVLNYAAHGDLSARPGGRRCAIYKGIFGILFRLLDDKKYSWILESWV